MHQTTGPRQPKGGFWILGILVLVVGAGLLIYSFSGSDSSDQQESDLLTSNGHEQLLMFSTPDSMPLPETSPTPEPSPTAQPVIIYISGAVLKPDVYELPARARVKDAVLAAGGLTDEAAYEQVNLAAQIEDAQHIHIPREGETDTAPLSSSEAEVSQAGSSNTININAASATELQQLKGIGDVLAQRILDYRAANGPFTSIEELQNVRGISTALIDEIQAEITVGQ
jgi:competence protein ComEA